MFRLLLSIIIILAVSLTFLFGQSGTKEKSNMKDEKTMEQEYHKRFAVQLNNLVWSLLKKADRTDEENQTMINASHASLYHWSVIGEPVNFQRGEWLVSHVYAIMKRPEPALYHAARCVKLTEQHKLVDFDLAYAYEAQARAYAIAGDKGNCQKYTILAEEAGKKIKEEEDRKQFLSDLAAEPWNGLK